MHELLEQMDKEWQEERDTINAFRRDGEAALKRARAAQEQIEVMRESQVSL